MKAGDALKQSKDQLIACNTTRGLVTIYHQPQTGDVAEGFHVRFIPCDAHGHFNAAGTVTVGSYEDLDTALTIAAVSYGVGEDDWTPAGADSLARYDFGEHAPAVEGRRIIHPDDSLTR